VDSGSNRAPYFWSRLQTLYLHDLDWVPSQRARGGKDGVMRWPVRPALQPDKMEVILGGRH